MLTGSRRLENRIVIPGSFLAWTTSQAIATKFEGTTHSHGHKGWETQTKTIVFVMQHSLCEQLMNLRWYDGTVIL